MGLKTFRIFFMICACGVMLKIAGSSVEIFRSIFIFSFGLMYDYASLFSVAKIESNPYNKVIAIVSFIISGLYWLISLAGLSDLIKVSEIDKVMKIVQSENVLINVNLDYQTIVYCMFIFVFSTALEIFGGINRHVQVPSVKGG